MAKQVIIENPILNSPFQEPARHFKFDDDGITNEVAERRRVSAYFVPVPRPRKRGKQKGLFETEWTDNRLQENEFINDVRGRVDLWRKLGRPGTTKLTARLLEHWTRSEHEPPLFFCQVEAAETAIYLAEVAPGGQDAWLLNRLRDENDRCNPGLFRMAFKMATGSGKTVLMAMLIAWQALNKLRHPQSTTFSDTFLVVTPGITIRDRLRVLLPNDPDNYYRKFDIVPGDMVDRLHQAKIHVTNFHQMLRRERVSSSKLTKAILTGGGASPFQETPDQRGHGRQGGTLRTQPHNLKHARAACCATGASGFGQDLTSGGTVTSRQSPARRDGRDSDRVARRATCCAAAGAVSSSEAHWHVRWLSDAR